MVACQYWVCVHHCPLAVTTIDGMSKLVGVVQPAMQSSAVRKKNCPTVRMAFHLTCTMCSISALEGSAALCCFEATWAQAIVLADTGWAWPDALTCIKSRCSVPVQHIAYTYSVAYHHTWYMISLLGHQGITKDYSEPPSLWLLQPQSAIAHPRTGLDCGH